MIQQEVVYNYYSDKFAKSYEKAMCMTLKEIKDFCIQIATAYSIIHMEETESIPQIKAVVYSPASDTYYIHSKDLKFLQYLLPRLQRFFLTPEFGYEKFNIEYDFIDNENFSIEININDESTILNNSFFHLKPTSL
jgi:hypothetical protein